MARFSSLFSSSSGNATYIGCANSGILVDVGVSAKRITKALDDINININSLAGIFITHEHTDHVQGLRVFASRHHIPTYATRGTLEALLEKGHLTNDFSIHILPYEGAAIGDMFVTPFQTSHDSRESCGYTIQTSDERKIGVCTDLGIMTDDIIETLQSCDLVLIESNHDEGMLKNGAYPHFLKRRILSNEGHLSNEICANTLCSLVDKKTTRFILGHLSQENNMPILAHETAKLALTQHGAVMEKDFLLEVAGSSMISLTQF